jgi:hypothetical protein
MQVGPGSAVATRRTKYVAVIEERLLGIGEFLSRGTRSPLERH